MPIDKIIPRSLNKDDDYLTVKSVEMIDALNVNISSDNEGNAGVIKNTWGNTKVPIRQGDALTSGTNRVVGSCVNREKNEILFAVFNSNNNHSLYWYGVEAQQVRLVIRDSVLAFQLDSYVKMDTIVKENGDTLLYFNDTETDPKKINITKALTKVGYPYRELVYFDEISGQNETYFYTDEERLLSITASKQPPLQPPTVSYVSDPNLKESRVYDSYFQFAYQYIYEDGEVSSISPYSILPLNSSQLLDGLVSSDSKSVFNAIDITFQRSLGDVRCIRILARQAGTQGFFVVDEVDNVRSILQRLDSTRFSNRISREYVPQRDVAKLFDSVPLTSGAQAITSNRVIYGNNNESFDNHPVSADVAFNYQIAENSYSVIASPTTNTNQDSTDNSGFFMDIDISNLPASSSSGLDLYFDVTATAASIVINEQLVHGSTVLPSWELARFRAGILKSIFIPPYANRLQAANLIKDELIGDYGGSSDGSVGWSRNNVVYATTGTLVVSMFFDNISSNVIRMRWYVKSVDVSVRSTFNGIVVPINKIIPELVQNALFYKNENQSTLFSFISSRSFKRNQLQEIGVVYYDSRGRSGAVNRIGSFTPLPVSDSPIFGLGAVEMNVRIKNPAPSWAKKWQLVYSPYASYSFMYAYSAAEAFTTELNSSSGGRPIYVSLRHLEGKPDSYKEASGATFDYSYVKGDRLRVLSYSIGGQARAYPKGFDFEITGLESFDTTNSPIYPNAGVSDLRKSGLFLALRDENHQGFSSADIHSGSSQWGLNVIFEIYRPSFSSDSQIYYEIGECYDVVYDSITDSYRHKAQRDFQYNPNFSLSQNRLTVTTVPLIGLGLVNTSLDIRNGDIINVVLSEVPFATQAITVTNVYNNDGIRFFFTSLAAGTYRVSSISNISDSVVSTTSGDVYFRLRNLKMNLPVSNVPSASSADIYYERLFVEDMDITDLSRSQFINSGRANAVSKDIKNVTRKASVSYSDSYALDTSILGLSSFNASEANFVDLQAQHGAIRYIATNSDSIIVLQETKCSVLPVSRNTIEYLDGGTGVTVSNTFLGQQSFYAGDYGVGNHPESVAEFYGKIFFADHRNGKVVRISADGIELISEQGMDSFFQSIFEDLNRLGSQNFKIYGGIDPRNKEYIISIQKISGSFSFENQTVGYSIDDRVWTSRYSYMPETVTEINGGQYTFNAGEMYVHAVGSPSNTFYGSFTPSRVSIIASSNSSMVKHFEAISTESTAPWSFKAFTSVNLGLTDPSRQETAVVLASSMTKKEGFYYHEIPTDSLAVVPYMLGTVISVAGATGGLAVKVGSPVNSLPLPLGALVYKVVSGVITPTTYTLSGISQRDTVLIAGTGPILANDILAVASDNDVDGEKLRGPYVRIDLENGLTTPHETYAFNVWFTRSGMHNELVN